MQSVFLAFRLRPKTKTCCMKNPIWYLLFSCMSLLLLAGCGRDAKQDTQQTDTLLSAEDSLKTAELDAIVATFPNPIQLANLLKNAGAKYKDGLLNNPKNVSNYQTTEVRAVNLGIYSADMAYSHVFDKRQDALKYLSAVRQLSEQLNLGGIFDKKLESSIQANQDNPDSLTKLFSQTLSRVKERLIENREGEILNLMFSGAFVEGLYIAVQLYADNRSQEMANQIAEQKINLQRLVRQVEVYKEDASFRRMHNTLAQLTKAYDGVIVEYQAPTEPAKVEAGKPIQLGGRNNIQISDAQIQKLLETITPLRNQFTE